MDADFYEGEGRGGDGRKGGRGGGRREGKAENEEVKEGVGLGLPLWNSFGEIQLF